MRYLKFCLIYFVSFFLVGCLDKIEAEDRGYIITMGIDNGVEKKYDISFLIAQFSDNGDTKTTGKIIKISADSIIEAVNKANSNTNKLLYLGQLKTVILGENILNRKNTLIDILEQLENNKDVSVKTVILATKGNAEDMANLIAENELSSGIYIYDFYKNSAEQTAFTEKVELEKLTINMRENKSALIPVIYSYDNQLKINGSIIVDNNGIKDFISEESFINNIWLNNKAEGYVIVDDNGNTLEILDNYCSYKFYEKDSYILCDINIKARGSIDGIYDKNNIFNIEKNFENIISNNILNYINKLKLYYKVDPLGFSLKLKKYNNNLYYKYNKENSFVNNMNFNVNCDIKIKSTGISD